MVQVWSKLYNHNAENLLLVLCTTMLLLCLCGVIRFLSLWLKCLLHSSPAAPQTLLGGFLFFFRTWSSLWTSQDHTGSFLASGLSMPTRFQSCSSHLFLTSSSFFSPCPSIISPEVTILSACDSISSLDLSSLCCYFLSGRQSLFFWSLCTATQI